LICVKMRPTSVDFVKAQFELLEKYLPQAPLLLFVLNDQGVMSYISTSAALMLGGQAKELTGKNWGEMDLPPGFYDAIYRKNLTVLQTGNNERGEVSYPTVIGESWFEYNISPVMNEEGRIEGTLVTVGDTTERHQKEDLSVLLNEVNQEINSSLNFEDIMNRVVVNATKAMGSDGAGIALKDNGDWVLRYGHGLPENVLGARFSDELMKLIPLSSPDEAVIISDTYAVERFDKDILQRFHLRAALLCPLKVRTEIIGALGFAYYSGPQYFNAAQVDFARKLGASVSMALSNAQSFEREQNERIRLRAILDTLPVGVSVMDSKGRSLIRNKIMDDFLGSISLSEGFSDYARFTGYRSGTDSLLTPEEWPMARTLLKGEVVSNEELDVQGMDGTRKTVLSSSLPIREKGGKIAGGIVVFTDISHQKDLERELKRSNAELQQFAYVASHDLQEPLRMVVSYLSLLKRHYQDKLDLKGLEYLQFAVDGGERMKALINDLLAYSKVETMALSIAPVDMNAVVSKTLEVMELAINESEAEMIVNHLPIIRADEFQMGQVMQNLISNALKFHGDRKIMIQISSSTGSKEHIFIVQDNGIGLDMKNSDRIFQMFQRLHTRDEYKGTGIGLSIVKKIIERHGGRVWVESELGKGATFFFTIPIR
jgi:PAS domain S-box-containing protein